MEVAGRSHEADLRREIRTLDQQSVPVPPAPRVPIQLTDARRQVRAPVERNDACFVDEFHVQRDVPGSLDNLVVTVGTGAEDAAHPWRAERQAAPIGAHVLWAVRVGSKLGRAYRGLYLLALLRQSGNLSIGRIHDQRGSRFELSRE